VQSRGTLNSEHSRHDRLLVARYAAGDSYPTERDQAERLVTGCDECAALSADIQLISTRTSHLTPVRRPRDFRISPEQAQQLRGSWLDRMLRGLAAPGWTVVRPLAGAALAIGMVLVVIGALPLNNFGSGADAQAGAPAPAADSLAGMPTPPLVAATPSQTQSETQPTDAPGYYVVQSPSAPGAGQTASSPEMSSLTPDPNVAAGSPPPPPATDVKALESPGATAAPETNPTSSAQTSAPSLPGQDLGVTSKGPPPPDSRVTASGQTTVGTTSQTTLDRNALINAGLLLGFLALLVLGIVWGLRSRYSDPLAR
jgi:hypothetical protein